MTNSNRRAVEKRSVMRTTRQELSNESLLLNIFFEQDPYSNEYSVAKKIGFDGSENMLCEVCTLSVSNIVSDSIITDSRGLEFTGENVAKLLQSWKEATQAKLGSSPDNIHPAYSSDRALSNSSEDENDDDPAEADWDDMHRLAHHLSQVSATSDEKSKFEK